MKLFELFLTAEPSDAPILSAEVLAATGAQIFSEAEAALVGLEGIPADPEGRPRCFIACRPADERLIESRLEHCPRVASFRLHELG